MKLTGTKFPSRKARVFHVEWWQKLKTALGTKAHSQVLSWKVSCDVFIKAFTCHAPDDLPASKFFVWKDFVVTLTSRRARSPHWLSTGDSSTSILSQVSLQSISKMFHNVFWLIQSLSQSPFTWLLQKQYYYWNARLSGEVRRAQAEEYGLFCGFHETLRLSWPRGRVRDTRKTSKKTGKQMSCSISIKKCEAVRYQS